MSFKAEDIVYSEVFGYGRVLWVLDMIVKPVFSVQVIFKSGETELFTAEGRYYRSYFDTPEHDIKKCKFQLLTKLLYKWRLL